MRFNPRSARLTTFSAACLVIAALFWMKLKLVRTMPKTAYAEPGAAVDALPSPEPENPRAPIIEP